MSRLNRGSKISGYYVTDPASPRSLYDQTWENSWPCGTFVDAQGKLKAVTFVHFLTDPSETEDDPEHAEYFKLNTTATTALQNNPVYLDLVADKLPDLTKIKPDPAAVIDDDIKDGKSKPVIANERKPILTGEFLGTTLAAAIRDWPVIWQPTVDVESGVEVPNIMRCSMEGTE
jgi:hypothetical protein